MTDSPYSKFSVDELVEVLTDMQTTVAPKREFVIQTGLKGAEMFNDAIIAEALRMRREAAFRALNYSIQQCIIPLSDFITYQKMIDSDDLETLTLAETLIEIKK
jgi:hypothetical protein